MLFTSTPIPAAVIRITVSVPVVGAGGVGSVAGAKEFYCIH
ncbi:hypothetical protein ACFLRY_00695 [Bacteroidota bacterium]